MTLRTLLCILALLAAGTFARAGEEPDLADPLFKQVRAEQLKKLEEDHREAFDKFRMMQRELQQLSGRTDVSAEGLQRTAARLDDQLEALLLEDAGSKARIEALAISIAEMRKKAEMDAERDDVAEELKKLVKTREKAFAYAQELSNNGAVSAAELAKASIELGEAKIRLLDRQRTVSTTAGSEALAAWNKELINLSVNEQERRARRAALEKQLAMIRRALDSLPQLQYEEERLKAVRARLLGLNYPAARGK